MLEIYDILLNDLSDCRRQFYVIISRLHDAVISRSNVPPRRRNDPEEDAPGKLIALKRCCESEEFDAREMPREATTKGSRLKAQDIENKPKESARDERERQRMH